MRNNENIIARLHSRHPHFAAWSIGFDDQPDLIAMQFAVIDKWGVGADRGDLDGLYGRLQLEIGHWVSENDKAMQMPTKYEFSRAVALHLPMILGIAWRRIEELPPFPEDLGSRRSRRQ